jgi:hypothetical protein
MDAYVCWNEQKVCTPSAIQRCRQSRTLCPPAFHQRLPSALPFPACALRSPSSSSSSSSTSTAHYLCDDFVKPKACLAAAQPGLVTSTSQSCCLTLSQASPSAAAAPLSSSTSPSAPYCWWQDASVVLVFVNATCYEQPLIDTLEARCWEGLSAGAVVITTTHQFPHTRPTSASTPTSDAAAAASAAVGGTTNTAHWELIARIPNISRYRSTAYIHRKL